MWFLSVNPVIDSITGILAYSILLTVQPNIWSKAEKKQHHKEVICMNIINMDNLAMNKIKTDTSGLDLIAKGEDWPLSGRELQCTCERNCVFKKKNKNHMHHKKSNSCSAATWHANFCLYSVHTCWWDVSREDWQKLLPSWTNDHCEN